MKIWLETVYVDDQAKALHFYTETLGFVPKADIPIGSDRWVTVASPDQPDGPELSLVPDAHPAVPPFKAALFEDGIPIASFLVDDLDAEVARLKRAGVTFTQEPLHMGEGTAAVLDDTFGNLIQVAQRD